MSKTEIVEYQNRQNLRASIVELGKQRWKPGGRFEPISAFTDLSGYIQHFLEDLVPAVLSLSLFLVVSNVPLSS
jgi:hypothetical protein